MHRLPRQESSSGAAQSSSDTPAPTTAFGSATGSQTSASATVTASSSSTTPTTSSSSADPTTSSGSTETTSTSPSPPSTSPSSTAVSSTTTPQASPASSSSIASETTSPTSSYVSVFFTTAYSPASSSSQPGTPTTITSTYTTYVNGSPLLTSTAIPSTIPQQSALSSSSDRTAIIAGSAAGGTALIVLLLSLAFCARRKRFKRLHFLDAITLRRRQARSRATLLDGEHLDVAPPPHRYTDYETPGDPTVTRTIAGGGVVGVAGVTPSPPAPRWSETGSAFREDLWPPPHEGTRLMDPLAHRVDFDLGRIVDDVMGPPSTGRHYSDNSVSTVHRGSVGDSEGTHSRTVSNASNAALLEAAGLGGVSTAPVRSSPLVQQETHPESAEHPGEAL